MINVPDSLKSMCVFVVDDEAPNRLLLERILNEAGFDNIVSIGDPDQVIEMMTERTPDIVILDAMLPKRSGFLVLEKLKPTKKKGERPFVIMITGNTGKRHQTWAETLGVDGYLNKPFRMDRLMDFLSKFVSSS